MKTYTQEELKEILELHKKWLNYDKEGVRANLKGANLYRVNLKGAYLIGANLDGANLYGVLGHTKHIKTTRLFFMLFFVFIK